MRTFDYVCFEVASSCKQHLHYFAKAEIKSDFRSMCFFYNEPIFFLKNINYGYVVIERFCHR